MVSGSSPPAWLLAVELASIISANMNSRYLSEDWIISLFFVKIGLIVFVGYRLKRTEETVSSLFGEVTLVVPSESIITDSSLCLHV